MESFIISNLEKAPHLYDKTIELIENSLHYQAPHKFDIDFAPLVNKKNWRNCFLLIDNNASEVYAHIGILKKNLTHPTNNISLPLILMGGIAVNERLRGRHLFSDLFNHILKNEEKNCGLFMLWSDLHQLYAKYDFNLAIGYEIFNLTKANNHHYHQVTFSQLTDQDKANLRSLYQKYIEKKYMTFHREQEDWDTIFKITSSHLYLNHNSYFFVNKGQDLSNIIHELAIEETQKFIDNPPLANCTLWLPEQGDKNIGFNALVRLGSSEIFSSFLRKFSQEKIKVQSLNSKEILFSFEGSNYKHKTGDFLCALFGPYPLKEFSEFSCPIFISGLDSI